MEQTYLPGKIRDRIRELMNSQKVTKAELATSIGVLESILSCFISGNQTVKTQVVTGAKKNRINGIHSFE